MSRLRRHRPLPLLLLAACAAPVPAPPGSDAAAPPPIAAALDGAPLLEGFVGLAHDPRDGRLRLALEPDGGPFLHVVALVAGLGSNDVGLDRGQLSVQRVLTARRAGRRLELVAPNLDFRVADDAPELRRAAAEAFAEGVVASLEILGEDADGRVLVDATALVTADAHGVVDTLRRTGQGAYRLDPERTHVVEGGLGAFADNAYVDVRQTFAGDAPGGEVRSVAPVPEAVTLTVRHHFARLPEEPLRPRTADPRAGYFTRAWRLLDAAPDAPDRVEVITRHRLPADGSPIVYHLDRGVPEPMRTALLEGARYWERAFEAAGLPGRFRVELLPEGADVHDLAYNTIQWVFRSTRGWSYGNSVVDPRSGEILKGHVTLGALRVRQDVRLIEALTSPYAEVDRDPRVMEAALARLRQLAAHEVGHTLGLRHHFAASTEGRASVMDYPPPRVELGPDGAPDVPDAYRDGPGEWDALAIRYGYFEFEPRAGESPAEAERRGLEEVLAEVERRGLELLSDADASAGIHPRAHRWDDGADASDALRDALAVRAAALERFGAHALRRGRALSDLELTLVPLYFWHRYQVDAAAAVIGGREFRHELRGDGEPVGLVPVASERQRAALEGLLASLDPEVLGVPDAVHALLAPPAPGSPRDRERFDPGDPLFDPLGAARAAAALVFDRLLDAERLERVAVQGAADDAQLDLDALLDALVDWGWRGPERDGRDALLVREARGVLLDSLLGLLAAPGTSAAVEAAVIDALGLLAVSYGNPPAAAFDARERLELARFLADPLAERVPTAAPRVPPGPPIGCGHEHGWGGLGDSR